MVESLALIKELIRESLPQYKLVNINHEKIYVLRDTKKFKYKDYMLLAVMSIFPPKIAITNIISFGKCTYDISNPNIKHELKEAIDIIFQSGLTIDDELKESIRYLSKRTNYR